MAKVFSLENKSLKLDSAADIEQHIQPLKDDADVEEVRFQGNTLGVEACAALAKVLETKKSIQNANLADIFTSRLLSEIPPSLSSLLTSSLSLPKLFTINLSDNAFGLNTVEPLRPFLSQHVPLQHLILNNNGLGPAAGTLVAEALTQLAERKSQARKDSKDDKAVPELETVVCGRNRLEAGSMAAWVKAYGANTGVRHVRMVQNGIRPDGIVPLLRDGLSRCNKLETLDLQDNTFTASGSKALADAINAGAWPELKELAVGDCLLSARGGVAVLTALAQGKCPKLEVLKLQYNEIDAKGVKALADGLKTMPALRKVELNGNKFGEEDAGAEKIRETLEERREAAGEEEDEERWGLDELDDLEEESDEEDEEAEEDEEEAHIVRDAEAAEDQPVAAEKDKDVDELAKALGKTEIK
ncbi:RNI-like protein [Myriangium duriaei CBS 260.36]|uniref:RNI-like protein n=1 Tax=Myriangium duriaei CBS 260.36 TaxID=1168546 RepID=A0A9P4MKA3_9PEZI|nr:RNI-like protein [Myriangium duriaei CBS 260.36]